MLCHVSEFHSFLSPDNIPLYVQLTLEHGLGVPDSSPPPPNQKSVYILSQPFAYMASQLWVKILFSVQGLNRGSETWDAKSQLRIY